MCVCRVLVWVYRLAFRLSSEGETNKNQRNKSMNRAAWRVTRTRYRRLVTSTCSQLRDGGQVSPLKRNGRFLRFHYQSVAFFSLYPRESWQHKDLSQRVSIFIQERIDGQWNSSILLGAHMAVDWFVKKPECHRPQSAKRTVPNTTASTVYCVSADAVYKLFGRFHRYGNIVGCAIHRPDTHNKNINFEKVSSSTQRHVSL